MRSESVEGAFEVAVIGGGVVGCAVLRALTLQGYASILLEKQPFLVGSNASGGNTGIACTPTDTAEGSLERKCLIEAIRLNEEIYPRLNIPHDPQGALYVAWTADELERLQELTALQNQRGDAEVRLISREELLKWEPELSQTAQGAMFVPGEVLVDSWLVPIAWAQHALENGARIELDCPVLETNTGADAEGKWKLRTAKGAVTAKVVINCGGLWADEVEAMQRVPPFQVRPKRGDYVVFANQGTRLLTRPLGQVPQPDYRGVYVWQTIHGNIACGPTAQFQDERHATSPTDEVAEKLRAIAVQALPALAHAKVLGTYSGLRPATQFSDYQIAAQPERRWVIVGGVRSTGLTASLGIGQHVLGLVESTFGSEMVKTLADRQVRWTPLPDLDQVYQSFHNRGDGTVEINGWVHMVTHPLAKMGYQDRPLRSRM